MCLYSMAINVLISITKTIKQTLTVLLRHGFNIFVIFNGHFRNRLIGGTYHKQGNAARKDAVSKGLCHCCICTASCRSIAKGFEVSCEKM